MHKNTRSILGNPSQQGKYLHHQEKDLHHQENLAHKRVLANPRRLEPKRGVHFSQEYVLVEISKLTQKI
jgi:hypothetical protein